MTIAAAAPFARYRPPAPEPLERPLGTLAFLRALTSNPLNVWTRQAYEEPFVDLPGNVIGPRLLVNDPEAIRRILVENEGNYLRDDLQLRILRRTIGLGLFTAEGAAWRAQRKVVAPLFSARAVSGFLPAMAAAAEAGIERLSASPDGTVLDVAEQMSTIALDVLERTLFRDGFRTPLAEVGRHSKRFVDGAGAVTILDVLGLPEWIPGLRLLRVRSDQRALSAMVDRMIAARRAAPPKPDGEGPETRDILSALLAAADRETGIGLSEREVRDNVLTFIGAGHETTGYALSWALFLLSGAPDVRAAAEAEADAVLGSDREAPAGIADLPLVRAVIEESMRLYPTAPFLSRVARQDDVIGGRPIRAGSLVLIVPWLLHRHRRLWSDPDVFDPGRFLPDRRESVPRFAYLPFGAGPRVCIGSAFALQEATLVLARILSRFRFDLAPGHVIEPVQRITLRPRGGMPMILRHRAAPTSGLAGADTPR
ncbi:cytochrome P450 [Prosthecomicrobium sp. N25]|uniref:cytochrome P450 n=1 Tax=Prosthecomicrobium sp. N25 TaxID=3129254 RepID=UPI0030769999